MNPTTTLTSEKNMREWKFFGGLLAMFSGGFVAWLIAAVIVLCLNLCLLGAAVWVVVTVLQHMGVI